MSHYSKAIRISGAAFEYSSNMYDHLHIALMKTAYRSSNKKYSLSYIVEHNRMLQALREKAIGRKGFLLPEGKNTPLIQVHIDPKIFYKI